MSPTRSDENRNPPVGWYPDPERPAMLRWWDGTQWTSEKKPATTVATPASSPLWFQVSTSTLVSAAVILVALLVGIVVFSYLAHACGASPSACG